mmetsp:Transcript_31217/g.58606  ORF Transcript_31217/g.58606 Transcript_31217/m.58606 type:complete len:200 (-) Transcript_31217:9-608(-)
MLSCGVGQLAGRDVAGTALLSIPVTAWATAATLSSADSIASGRGFSESFSSSCEVGLRARINHLFSGLFPRCRLLLFRRGRAAAWVPRISSPVTFSAASRRLRRPVAEYPCLAPFGWPPFVGSVFAAPCLISERHTRPGPTSSLRLLSAPRTPPFFGRGIWRGAKKLMHLRVSSDVMANAVMSPWGRPCLPCGASLSET